MKTKEIIRMVERKMVVGLPLTRKERATYMLFAEDYTKIQGYGRAR